MTHPFPWRRLLSWLLLLAAVPAVVLVSTGHESGYYLSATLVILLVLCAFLLRFERRRVQARELVLLAVMSALAVAGRAVFAPVPHFKPMAGIVMITALAFGPEAGFLCGAVSVFASNFLFGQGPWTPWQMLAYGLAGALAGALAQWGVLPRQPARTRDYAVLGIFGFLSVLVLLGPLLDTCTLLLLPSMAGSASAGAVYLAGLPVNAVHGAATGLTLVLLARPLLEKLRRIQVKYGMMEM